jgi:signal transduction histidine kinase
MILTDFSDLIAERMRVEHRMLAARWFERLLDLLPVQARDVFPTASLLDHIPALILEISAYLRQPQDEAIASNTAILDKARELGVLRHAQRASLHQLLREYQLLSSILTTFVLEEMEAAPLKPSASDSVTLVARLQEAVNVLSQSTVETFVALYTKTIAEQGERLEQFTRMAAHEWRQPLGALQFGVGLLAQKDIDPSLSARALDAVQRNVSHLVELTHKLEAVARMNNPADNPVIQHVSSATIAFEAARQLRDMAESRLVEIRIADGMPSLTVDVGRLELAFVNLLSNAIKYSDAAKPARYIEVTGERDGDSGCLLSVRDNGVGIPRDALTTIFQRFTRAHVDRADLVHVGGVGLGLSIVDDCVRAMHGTIEVESSEGVGTTFVIRLPLSPPDA